MNHLDLFPSLLSLLGYEFKDGRLGLGFNIFNSVDLIFYNEFITNLDNSVENIESLIRTDNSLNHFLNNINSQISEFNRNNFENSYSQYNSDISNNYSPV